MTDVRVSMTRREIRLFTLQVLYEADVVRRDATRVLARRLEEESFAESAAAFADNLVRGVLENRDEIDKIISRFAPSWPVSQMATIERNILRLALYEIMMDDETPPKVVINEAVDLARTFGSEASPKFVNGVLGSVMETVKP